MTEERIKELAEETAKDIFEDEFQDLPYLQQRIMMVIKTVAAEARKEGIDEMNLKAFEESWCMGVSEDELDAFESRLCTAAERLKERG